MLLKRREAELKKQRALFLPLSPKKRHSVLNN